MKPINILIILLALFLLGCNQTINDMDNLKEYYDKQLNESNNYIEAKQDGNDELEQKVIENYIEAND